MSTVIHARDVLPQRFLTPVMSPAVSAVPQNEVQASNVADAIVRSGGTLFAARGTINGPLLEEPGRSLPDETQLARLLANLQPAEDGERAVAEVDALRELHALALQVPTSEERAHLSAAGGEVPRSLLDPARLAAVEVQLATLVGLRSGNGALVYPSPADLAALAGTAPPTSAEAAALGELLGHAPNLRAAIEEASSMDEKELAVRLHTDPRFAHVLLLVGFLMKLAASQREQAMAMLGIAEQAIKDMGSNMVESAKQARLAKVVALVVVVVVSAAAVAVGLTAATKNIGSIRNHQVKANTLNNDAAKAELKLAKGINEVGRASPMTQAQRTALREQIIDSRNQASAMTAAHGVHTTQSSVITQTGQVVGQAANAGGNVAGSGHEITAAELTARQEKRRADASTGQQTSQAEVQNAGKADETLANLFRQMQQAEQDKADTNSAILHRI